MPPRPITPSQVAAWRALFTRGPLPASTEARTRALRELMQRRAGSVRALIDLHDLVLFALAYPVDATEHALATRAMDHVAREVRRLKRTSGRNATALANTGLAHTSVTVAFSHELLSWLQQRHPDRVSLDSTDGDLEAAKPWLATLLPMAVRDAFELEDFELGPWLASMKGKRRPADLGWWLSLTRGLPPALRAPLFERLQLFATVDLADSGLSATYGRSPARALHTFPNGVPRKVDAAALLRAPLPEARVLSTAERGQLLDAARGILLCGLRETGPVTHAERVDLIDLGQGIDIALFHLPPQQRQAYDSYIGYVAFLNTVPAAYGGAWMFPGKTKVGVNVFPALRGGASALLFAQILRCYAQRYGVDRFEADPYQLGHGNEDGIASGAYWFYHRLGFMPADKGTQRVVDREVKRMAKDRGHRTTPALLRELAAVPMLLQVNEGPAPIEPVELSRAVMDHVSKHHAGDHDAALRAGMDRLVRALGLSDLAHWQADERHWAEQLAPAIDLVPDLERWTAEEKALLRELLRAKGGPTEEAYIKLLRGCPRLWKAWSMAVGASA